MAFGFHCEIFWKNNDCMYYNTILLSIYFRSPNHKKFKVQDMT